MNVGNNTRNSNYEDDVDKYLREEGIELIQRSPNLVYTEGSPLNTLHDLLGQLDTGIFLNSNDSVDFIVSFFKTSSSKKQLLKLDRDTRDELVRTLVKDYKIKRELALALVTRQYEQ